MCWGMKKTLRADTLASKLANGDIKCFRKKVKKYNSDNVANSNRIENTSVASDGLHSRSRSQRNAGSDS